MLTSVAFGRLCGVRSTSQEQTKYDRMKNFIMYFSQKVLFSTPFFSIDGENEAAR